MAELLVLSAVIGGVFYTINADPLEAVMGSPSRPNENVQKLESSNFTEFRDAGISYSVAKPQHLAQTNLNDAWKPWGAPRAKHTRNLNDIYQSEAERNAYIGAFAHPFYFQSKKGEIPLTTAAQSNPNVERGTRSTEGPLAALTLNNPRVYVDDPSTRNDTVFSEAEYKTFEAGEPELSLVMNVPREGQVNAEFNPWGAGGVLQRFYAKDKQLKTSLKNVRQEVKISDRAQAMRYKKY